MPPLPTAASVRATATTETPTASANGSSKKRKKGGEEAAVERAVGSAVPPEGGVTAEGAAGADDGTRVVRNYGGMLFFDFLAADVALVVEQPWLRVMDLLPPALYKHRFGT